MTKILCVTFLISTFCLFAFADTIRLKDGSVIKGKVISFRDGKFLVLIGTGERARQMTFFIDEIESIEFDSSDLQAPKTTEPSLAKGDGDRERQRLEVIKSDPLLEAKSNNKEVRLIEPIRIKVKVLADNTANGWTSAGFVVKKGQKIRVIGKGQVYLGNGNFCGPDGMQTLKDPDKLIPDKPTGALIAVIGDDNNDFIFIGAQNEFIAQRDGTLFLGVNEGYLDDNSGAFDVTVEIEPQ
ncbi:MAG: LecA/PA-IL family lectin [Pyrinomonadaceae bacterium]|nr:LecA/PA-IL family lectin [Pyrinomonadaceae bacterium]MCX7639735.1 LecA/PA-IL family lectin [Pyrinomonadaceae bacterium]MDW8304318.1 LecA/PA-IL family lectin [Acidobacteriota bacterium]